MTVLMPAEPRQRDVAEYIDNCIAAAREAMGKAEDRGEALVSTAYRAHTVVESETVTRYALSRAASLEAVRKLTDAQARKLGFAIARSKDEFRAIERIDTRADGDFIPIIGMRWDSRSDACPKCNSAHGELRPFGFAFTLPGPSAHARCKCTTSLWCLPLPAGERSIEGFNAMADKTNRSDAQAAPDSGNGGAGLAIVYRTIEVRESDIDADNRTIRGAIASDESEDSHGSVIRAKGWDLSRYEANPLLCWNHPVGGYERAKPEDVLGTATVEVKGKRLVADLHFLSGEVNPQAERVFKMMTAKPPAIRALSVGFRPTQYHFEKRSVGGDDLLVIDGAELYELSVLPIGSNPGALSGLREVCAKINTGTQEDSHSSAGVVPAVGTSQEATMSKENTEVQAPSVPALPPAIASRLACDCVDNAVAEIDKRSLEADKAAKDLESMKAERDAALAQRDALQKTIDEIAEKAAIEEVDGLVAAGRISADKRDAALSVYRSNKDAFRVLYPTVAPAPQVDLLAPANVQPEKAKPTQPVAENPIPVRAAELIKSGVEYDVAWSRAINEYRATVGA